MYSMRVSQTEEEGVMGYQVTTVTPANIEPRAAAWIAFNQNLALRGVQALQEIVIRLHQVLFGKLEPARAAFQLSSAALAFFWNCFWSALWISSMSMPNNLARTPS